MSGTTFLVDPDVLEACVERADRAIDAQREEMTEIYLRTEGLARLTVAGLGGIIATTGLLAGAGVEMNGLGVAGLAFGTALLFVALFIFISVITGYPRPIGQEIGPGPSELVRAASAEPWDLPSFHLYTLVSLSDAARHNTRSQARLSRRQAVGTFILGLATLVLTNSLGYILWSAIHG